MLVVEDDPEARAIVSRTLSADGWSVAEAENGKVGLDQMAAHAPDVIVLDLMMPVMDGFEFVRELRRTAEWRTIPVIVTTAKDLDDDDRRQLTGSVERILQKGAYSRTELLTELSDLVTARLRTARPEKD